MNRIQELEATLQAKDAKIDDMRLALASAIVRLREAECCHDGELASWYGQVRRQCERAFARAINEEPEYKTKDEQIERLLAALRKIKQEDNPHTATQEWPTPDYFLGWVMETIDAAIKEVTNG